MAREQEEEEREEEEEAEEEEKLSILGVKRISHVLIGGGGEGCGGGLFGGGVE
jgi:hypothetical protein